MLPTGLVERVHFFSDDVPQGAEDLVGIPPAVAGFPDPALARRPAVVLGLAVDELVLVGHERFEHSNTSRVRRSILAARIVSPILRYRIGQYDQCQHSSVRLLQNHT